LPSDEKSATA